MNRRNAAQAQQWRGEKVIQRWMVRLIELVGVRGNPVAGDIVDHQQVIIVIEKTHVREHDKAHDDTRRQHKHECAIVERDGQWAGCRPIGSGSGF